MGEQGEKMKKLIFITCILIGLSCTKSVCAEDNSCWLQAFKINDVWVIVYDESTDGQRLGVIWKGKIKAGEEVKISSSQGRIRYDYKTDVDQPYVGDISSGCFDGRTQLVD